MKMCNKCQTVKPANEFGNQKNSKDKLTYSCRSCMTIYARQWATDNLAKAQASRRRSKIKARLKLRAQVLAAYGGKCVCCNESIPEFLTVDHINNDGAKHRREIKASRYYVWLRQQGFPKDRFQLLCFNCNTAKARCGVCPHQSK